MVYIEIIQAFYGSLLNINTFGEPEENKRKLVTLVAPSLQSFDLHISCT